MRDSYRRWLVMPSESLRKTLGQAGIDPTAWSMRVAAYEWCREAVAGGGEAD